MSDMNLQQARHNMVLQQIRPWNLHDDRVLEAIDSLARDNFVPENYRAVAYSDCAIPLGYGATMLPPRIEAHMVQSVSLRDSDSVLVIGSGSGYLMALAARLARHVTGVELVPELTELARENLQREAIINVTLHTGDGGHGWSPKGELYEAILVTGSLPQLPQQLLDNLSPNGRLFVVVGEGVAMQALRIERTSAVNWQQQELFETQLPPLQNFSFRRQFSL